MRLFTINHDDDYDNWERTVRAATPQDALRLWVNYEDMDERWEEEGEDFFRERGFIVMAIPDHNGEEGIVGYDEVLDTDAVLAALTLIFDKKVVG